MKKEDLLILLFGFNILFILYFAPRTFESLKNMFENGNLRMNISYISGMLMFYFFCFIGMIGAFHYLQNKNIFNPFLKAFFIYNVFSYFTNLPRNLYYFATSIDSLDFQFIFFQIFGLIFTVLAIIIFSQEKIYVKEKPVQKSSTRFKHFFIDVLLLTIIYLQYSNSFYWLESFVNSSISSFIFILLMPYLFYLLYYWVSESVFQQTIGKVITKKYVRKIDGNRASSATILGRSLSRFIPFEPFSYLSYPLSGWHDNISNTNVFDRDEGLEDGIFEHLILKD